MLTLTDFESNTSIDVAPSAIVTIYESGGGTLLTLINGLHIFVKQSREQIHAGIRAYSRNCNEVTKNLIKDIGKEDWQIGDDED